MRRLMVCNLIFLVILLVGSIGTKPAIASAGIIHRVSPTLFTRNGNQTVRDSQQSAILTLPEALPSISLSPGELIQSPAHPKPHPCIRIVSFDARTQDAPEGFAGMAWTARILNLCASPLPVRITLIAWDDHHFALIQDHTESLLRRRTTNDTHSTLIIPIDTIPHITQYELQVIPR